MRPYELRDLAQARRFLLEGVWWQRVTPVDQPAALAAALPLALEWAREMASAGQPLAPLGIVADLGQAALGLDLQYQGARHTDAAFAPALPSALLRSYEDHVLGKAYADWTFIRAGDALRHYQDRDRARGVAFLLNQFRERAGFRGVLLSPAVLKALLEMRPDQVLAQGAELVQHGFSPFLAELYESVVSGARGVAELLAPEDVLELEHRTALAPLGQRLAYRQLEQAARALDQALPRQRPRPPARRRDVPTRVLEEDTYPVGGFSSLSTRGSIESLLHSQLVYMERDERPDLFDMKYLRDELLYYARDENQFLRRRRTFVFALFGDLVAARYKDAELPWQRIVLALGLLVAAVRRLCDWLSTDALRFEFVFVGGGEEDPLAAERELLGMVFRELIANRTVGVARVGSVAELAGVCTEHSRRSLCHCLCVWAAGQPVDLGAAAVNRLLVDGPLPGLDLADEEAADDEAADPLSGWARALQQLLGQWLAA
jgi:hypothetical protein